MTKKKHRQQVQTDSTISPVLRPLLWSALLGAAVAFAFTNPVYADPAPPNTVPNSGSRPQVVGELYVPGDPAPSGLSGLNATLPGAINGPLAMQISAMETEVAALGEQLLDLRQKRDATTDEVKVAAQTLAAAEESLRQAQKVADDEAAEALKEAAALPPGAFGTDLHELGALGRLEKGDPSGGDTQAAARELARATTAVKDARAAMSAADTDAIQATDNFTKAEAYYQTRDAALRKLRQDNAAQVEAIERQQEAAEQQNGAQYLNNASIDGKVANPRARAAVSYALAQRGDPYVWGSEGPNTFDCSGLVWASYRSKGANYFGLPRVARDQYNATRTQEVSPSALLPGDLLFFAYNGSWTSIHHVAMYIGGGRMVHAPTTGDVVRISTVSWSRLYKATRVFPAVAAPITAPAKPPTPPKPPVTTPPTHKPPTTKPPAPPKPPTGRPTEPTNPPTTNPPQTSDPTDPPQTSDPTSDPSTDNPVSTEPDGPTSEAAAPNGGSSAN